MSSATEQQYKQEGQEVQTVINYAEACHRVLQNSGVVRELETVRDIAKKSGREMRLDTSSSIFLAPYSVWKRLPSSDTLQDCVSLFWLRPSTTSEEVTHGGYLSEIPGDDDSFGGEVWVPEWKERVSFPSAEKVGILVRAFATGHIPDSLAGNWILDELKKQGFVVKDNHGVLIKEDLLMVGRLKLDTNSNNLFDHSYSHFEWACRLHEAPKKLPYLISEAMLRILPIDTP